MAPPSLGSSISSNPLLRLEQIAPPVWAHPEVLYYYPVWRTIRDTCEGERAIKERSKDYLPQFEGMDADDYRSYLDGATFYPFTARTAGALTGSIFRRQGVIEGLPDDPEIDADLDVVTKDKSNWDIFATFVAEEIIKQGRVGVLVDLPATPSTTPRPYLCTYLAENIIDWETDEIDGRTELVRVVLREGKLTRTAPSQPRKMVPIYRELILLGRGADAVYQQRVYEAADGTSEATLEEKDRRSTTTPQLRGKTLNYIPFRFFGPMRSTPTVEKPILEDIAALNISHYRSYAHLEHGRFFAGCPIYYTTQGTAGAGDAADFELGPSRVWNLPGDAKAGILELNGQGLKFLVDACVTKEAQAAALGGRIIGITGQSVSESDNQVKFAERNEQSQLLKVVQSLDAGLTVVLRWWLMFHDVTEEKAKLVEVKLNRDFLFDGPSAREFRAIHAMYKDGIVPIEVVFSYLKKGYIVPDWMSLDEFKTMLDDMDSFPNDPNFAARKEGFANALSRDQQDKTQSELDAAQELQDTQNEADLQAQAQQQKFQEKQANAQRKFMRSQPKPAPGAPQPGGGAPAPGNRPAPKPAAK